MKHILKYIDIIALFILGVIASFCGFIVYTMLCIGYMIWEFKAPDFLITSFQKDLERCYMAITIDNKGITDWLKGFYKHIDGMNTEEGGSVDRIDWEKLENDFNSISTESEKLKSMQSVRDLFVFNAKELNKARERISVFKGIMTDLKLNTEKGIKHFSFLQEEIKELEEVIRKFKAV